MIEHRIITDSMYLQQAKDFISEKFTAQKPGPTIAGSHPRPGQTSTTVHPSPQGQLDSGGIENAVWLAFCSGTYLKRDDRQIPMPLGNLRHSRSEYSDKTIVFRDDFGLPKSVELYATNDQLLCEYNVLQSANFLGVTFPLKFRATQFWDRPMAGGATIRSRSDLLGRVTLIKVGSQPELPEEVRLQLKTLRRHLATSD